MRWPSRLDLGIYAVCGLLIAVIGWRALSGGHGGAAPAGPAPRPSVSVAVRDAPTRAVVYVVGAVHRPGVYTLKEGQRVRDAVARAGGPTAAADLAAVNLAGRIVDAQQVVVPTQAAIVTGGAPPAAAAAPVVSLSTATVEQLDTLDGVGPATAEKIVAYRTEHGGFRALEELAEVPGIGPKKLEGLRGQLQP